MPVSVKLIQCIMPLQSMNKSLQPIDIESSSYPDLNGGN